MIKLTDLFFRQAERRKRSDGHQGYVYQGKLYALYILGTYCERETWHVCLRQQIKTRYDGTGISINFSILKRILKDREIISAMHTSNRQSFKKVTCPFKDGRNKKSELQLNCHIV